MDVPLYESARVTLNGSGNGTAKVGPLSAREVWHPANVHVSVATNTNEAVCNVYAGVDATPPNFRDATFSGSSGDSTDKVSADTIKCGQYVFAVWTGGDANQVATMTVTGTKTI